MSKQVATSGFLCSPVDTDSKKRLTCVAVLCLLWTWGESHPRPSSSSIRVYETCLAFLSCWEGEQANLSPPPAAILWRPTSGGTSLARCASWALHPAVYVALDPPAGSKGSTPLCYAEGGRPEGCRGRVERGQDVFSICRLSESLGVLGRSPSRCVSKIRRRRSSAGPVPGEMSW